ncbi:MAG: hypothetical protein HW421_3511 [Ignavibacteria bacterium]|nr:hypothetical protein [Ignavibacteria bacterium]
MMIISKINSQIEFMENLTNKNKGISNASIPKLSGINIYDRVDKFFDLGAKKDLSFSDMTETEKDEFLRIVAKMLRSGLVGYNYFEKNGKIEKHFIESQMLDRTLKHKRLIRS